MLDNKEFNDNIIKKIKEENIQPKARWQFLLKDSLIWALGVFSLILGGVAASLIYYVSQHENVWVYRRAGSGFAQSLFFMLPIFWIICLILFVGAVYYYFKHTRKGYKYSNWQVSLMIGVFVIFLASMLSVSKLNAKMEDVMSQKVPYYDKVVNPGVNFWSKPEEGRLMGVIVEKVADDEYHLIDIAKDEWALKINKAPQAHIPPGGFIRAIGRKNGDHKFTAEEILPLGPGRGFLNRPGMKPKECLKMGKDSCLEKQIKKDKFEKIRKVKE